MFGICTFTAQVRYWSQDTGRTEEIINFGLLMTERHWIETILNFWLLITERKTFWKRRNTVLKDKQYLLELFFPMFKNRCAYSASKFACWIFSSQIHSNYQNVMWCGLLWLSIPSFSSLFSPPLSPMSASLKRSSFFNFHRVEKVFFLQY